MIDARHSPPRGGESASDGPGLASWIADAFARGEAASATAFWAKPRLQPMIQRLLWTRSLGRAELALVEAASHRKKTYQLFVISNGNWLAAGDFRRYADALAVVDRWVGYLEAGGTVRAWLEQES
ncbi:hypothetical protein [Mycobacterium sp. Marseille-P9652]|uniref:hypothetical protein n=1 Tax=Mycobacterium sp. Marseille-P9652 TaxID=2654950 RepID=UPI0012E8E09F|nr:hypothetical protein [Mycobacterium sp. Marseille-P9652]